ncbi:MAG: Gfo/Idh/MocA family oxidoreductase [Sodalis sp. (in: enterobacteria)]|uniref:Gfo/Idh/MocA family oxidoreductase n=1 Tax=Sodalis sp. (in: enterobacteria) TaxID=1898979 RepID=UPI0039E48BF5
MTVNTALGVRLRLDSQEDSLKAGERPGGPCCGADKQDGVLTLIEDSGRRVASQPTLPGNYPAYYQGIHGAVRGAAPNPVPAEEAIRVMELIELGIKSTEQRKTLPVKNG